MEVGLKILRLALTNRNITRLRLYGRRATYSFNELINAIKDSSQLKKMDISYPCPQLQAEQMTPLHCHNLSAMLPKLNEIVLRFHRSSDIVKSFNSHATYDAHFFKLETLTPQHCLELCTILVQLSGREGPVHLHPMLRQARRYSIHR
jgi:hypothetical protein